MKNNKHVLRIALLSTVFALGISTVTFLTATHKEVDATQYIGNYSPYTYSGDYYKDIHFNATGGMNGALRQELSDLIYPNDWYSYSGNTTGTLSEQLQEADEDPTNHSNMVLFYTRDSRTKVWANPGPGTSSATEVWNREHVWCQSLSNNNWGTSKGGTDILHLRPTYKSTNSTRNNHPYGNVVNKVQKTYNKMFYGYLEDGGDLFEPLDCVKGDVARIIMYVWTTYNNASKPLNIKSVFESYDTLLQWHTMDKPDALEGHRNDWAESSIQQNRNPFVDHPELGWKIFGDAAEHSSYKDACMAAYPDTSGGDPITPTGISLDKTTASIAVNATTQLTASVEPFGATGTVSWSSNNTSVATVSNTGLVTGVSEGVATITATINTYSASCTVTVTDGGVVPQDVEKIASYDFGSHTDGTSEYSTSNALLTRINNSVVTGQGLSNIVTSVSGISKAYAGYGSYLSYGLKIGTGDVAGAFTLGLNREVSKVVVKTAGWGTGDYLKVGDAATQTPGVAYTGAGAIKTLTYNITPSNSVAFLYTKRGFIQSIDFYAESEVVEVPTDYLTSVYTFATITGTEVVTGSVSTVDSDFASAGLGNETSIENYLTVGEVTLTGTRGSHGSLKPRYFTSNHQVRMYAGNVVTFSSEQPITRIEFTFSNNYGTGLAANVGLLGGIVWIGSATSIEFSNTSDSQVRFTDVTVTYGNRTVSVNKPYLRFGATIAKDDWDAIADKWTISDYGVALVKYSTLHDTYHMDSISEAFDAEKSLALGNKGSGETPYLEGDNYVFSVKINMTNSSYRDIDYCAAPYIVIDDTYYFLDETHRTFNETLDECIDDEELSDLSLEALLSLKTN